MMTRRSTERIEHAGHEHEHSRHGAVTAAGVVGVALTAMLTALLAAVAGGCGDTKNETVWKGTVTDYSATSGVETTGQ